MEEYTLPNFLMKLKKILEDIYTGQNLIFKSSFREHFEGAWMEAISELRTLSMRIEILREPELQQIGLSTEGNQIKLKLSGLFESYDDYERNGGISRAKKILKYSKIVLGSLGKLIPGAEFIKEFIEAIEMGIEEAEK